jgi:hypothetical protein
MSKKLISVYFIFQVIKLLRVSLDVAFFSGIVLVSLEGLVLICNTNLESFFYYLGPIGFDFVFLILGHSVLYIGLFKKIIHLFCYLFFVLLLFTCKFFLYNFFGHFKDSPGLANLFFYLFDLFVFWILELGLFPIALTFIKSNHDKTEF